jgi:hypothetical protein
MDRADQTIKLDRNSLKSTDIGEDVAKPRINATVLEKQRRPREPPFYGVPWR